MVSAGSHRKEKAPVASTKSAGHACNSHPLTATSRAGAGRRGGGKLVLLTGVRAAP